MLLPLQPYPMHILAQRLLLRHQASLKDQHSLRQKSLWVQLLLKHFVTVTFTRQQHYSAHLELACISTLKWPPEAWLPQVIVNSAGAKKTTAVRSQQHHFRTPKHPAWAKKKRETQFLIHPVRLVLGAFQNNNPFHLWQLLPLPWHSLQGGARTAVLTAPAISTSPTWLAATACYHEQTPARGNTG